MNANIEQAMAAEQQYIEDSFHNPLLSLYDDYLKQYGYDNLQDYFYDKDIWQITNATFTLYLDEDTTNIDQRVWQAIIDKQSCVWVPKLTSVLACVGVDEFDYDLAEELEVPVLKMPHAGGTIITGPDDLTIGIHFYNTDSNACYDYYFKKLKAFTEPYGITTNGNDFMYNGHKVIGTASAQISLTGAFFFSASFSDHSDLIEKLCKKTSSKISGIIPSELFTKEELKNEVLSWLNTHT